MAPSSRAPNRSCYHPRSGHPVHAILAKVCDFDAFNDIENLICSLSRWLVNQGREDEALAVLSRARGEAPDSDIVQIEFL